MAKSDKIFSEIRKGGALTRNQQIKLTIQLSMPAIMSHITYILMTYIDTSMVGRLGANASAAVGLVTTITWFLWGLSESFVIGFAVMVAHRIGANNIISARAVLRQAITFCLITSLIETAIALALSQPLPHWLNGSDDICADASNYLFIFSCGLPFIQMNYLASSMLRSEGNVRVPSVLNIIMCVLDVVCNFFLIYPNRTFNVGNIEINIPGMGLGVSGAALGSVLADALISCILMYYLVNRAKLLALTNEKGSFALSKQTITKSIKISFPIGIQRIIINLAYIVITAVVAPLGNIAIAADTFAVTIEGICYMPGYGISDAATTLVGQCIGASRRYLAKSFAYISTILGIIVLTIMSVFMYIYCPFLLQLMTPDSEIVKLGSEILRIEAFAEPMFAAAIISYGAFIGAGDSLIPSTFNLLSMWIIRVPLVVLLAPIYGLKGVWFVMALELVIRGLLFLARLRSNKWLVNTLKPLRI